jgi:hypothetical protein
VVTATFWDIIEADKESLLDFVKVLAVLFVALRVIMQELAELVNRKQVTVLQDCMVGAVEELVEELVVDCMEESVVGT